MTSLPDPRGRIELEAGARLEKGWAERAAKLAAERRARAAAWFWQAVEARQAEAGAVRNVTSITARARASGAK